MDLRLDRASKADLEEPAALGQLESIPPQTRVFTSNVEWVAFWKEFKIMPPNIDFAKSAAILVIVGQRPTSGYFVEVRHVFFQAEQRILRIEVVEIKPPPNVGTLDVLTFPYDLVTFAKPGVWESVQIDSQKEKGKP